ncbi:Ada metal-binding domain-containing protein [Sphingobacterium sp. UBA6645]|uniref:Ada metal-binding domain-containing protein n=1 Tax=Sphingobacterium sp. UBA6645 TaxID=1947511 RepID=UPI0025E52ABE|nr:Ada metal-binding domain-containing protein [Sphingobacterium sp. UBA6645]
MKQHVDLTDKELHAAIRGGNIQFAGNTKLKIYGLLSCSSGKRMKRANRVFFETAEEALAKGYRPCGNCMCSSYQNWKQNTEKG